ncbi:hypothetical protein Pcinc_036942 [Petrolisthes cinctipes]|uniref:Uncharacterized protein n=1 Tax=Petrolisthes cinctipes TaxID=88211 RepID=A0AAE1BWW9_PETCI|nr:hypothetical protein Pcinc_036942 [Petrolisthes cinctipes]
MLTVTSEGCVSVIINRILEISSSGNLSPKVNVRVARCARVAYLINRLSPCCHLAVVVEDKTWVILAITWQTYSNSTSSVASTYGAAHTPRPAHSAIVSANGWASLGRGGPMGRHTPPTFTWAPPEGPTPDPGEGEDGVVREKVVKGRRGEEGEDKDKV